MLAKTHIKEIIVNQNPVSMKWYGLIHFSDCKSVYTCMYNSQIEAYEALVKIAFYYVK